MIALANQRRTLMTGNAINANSEALELRDLSSEELDAVSGGFISMFFNFLKALSQGDEGTGGCSNDPCAQFQQIMQQMTQGQ
jgi:hypothetical protein